MFRYSILIIWLLLIIAGIVITNLFFKFQPPQDIGKHLQQGVIDCNDSQSRNSCTKKLAISDLHIYKFEEILDALDNLQRANSPQQFHDYLHFLATEEYYLDNDVSRMFIKCTPVYFNACYHGVVIGLLDSSKASPESEEFKDMMINACNVFIKNNQQGFLDQCVHGVGHALMIVKDYELIQSLELCDQMSILMSTCYGGVFMENFPQSSSTDIISKYLPNDKNIYYPCNILDSKYQEQCYMFLTIYQNHVGVNDWTQTGNFCSGVPKSSQDECFGTIGSSVIATHENIDTLGEICSILDSSDEQKLFCYLGIVSSFDDKYGGNEPMLIESVNFCNSLESKYQKYCAQRVSWVLNRWLDEQSHYNACQKFIHQELIDICRIRSNTQN